MIGRLDLLEDAIHILHKMRTNFYSFNYPAVVLSSIFLSQFSVLFFLNLCIDSYLNIVYDIIENYWIY